MANLIDRQAAIDSLDGEINIAGRVNAQAVIDYVSMVKDRLERLPSAEPQIIRCEDCKWYGRADKRRFYRGMDCLKRRIDTIVPDKDYCSRAERRTDD